MEKAALYIPFGVETLINIIAREALQRAENRRLREAIIAFELGVTSLHRVAL